MKEHFNKELLITKEDNENFKNSTKCWTCDNYYVDNYVRENIEALHVEIVIPVLN